MSSKKTIGESERLAAAPPAENSALSEQESANNLIDAAPAAPAAQPGDAFSLDGRFVVVAYSMSPYITIYKQCGAQSYWAQSTDLLAHNLHRLLILERA